MEALYTAAAVVTGGRTGCARVVDGPGSLNFALPHGFGGTGEAGYNPEQLFAAAYGGSFGAVLDLEARQIGLQLDEIIVMPRVSLGHGDDGNFMLDIALHIRLPGVERATAEQLTQAAHGGCPYSRMLKGRVEVRIVVDEPAAPE